MNISIITLKILLLLLPGYLTLIIKENLAEKKVRTDLEKILIILLYDIFIFLFYLGIIIISPILKPFILYMKKEDVNIVGLSFSNAFIIIGISILFGIILALFNNYSWGYKICQRLKITYKTGRHSVWNDVFNEVRGYWVIVYLEEGTRIFGWVRHYSADPEDKCLFIADAKYLGKSREQDIEINGPGVLIPSEAKIKLIEFLGK